MPATGSVAIDVCLGMCAVPLRQCPPAEGVTGYHRHYWYEDASISGAIIPKVKRWNNPATDVFIKGDLTAEKRRAKDPQCPA